MTQSKSQLRLGFINMTVSSVLQWPPQSPDLSPLEHCGDVAQQKIGSMNVQLTKKLCDAVASTWTRITWEPLQHLEESKK